MIPVTKPYLPDREKLDKYLDGIYERQWLTNNGQLVQELTRRLEDYLGVENLLLVANGTLALQIAYRALGVSGNRSVRPPEAITTPFTFIATASSLKWDGVEPIFADIDPDSWCLAPENIEAKITANTRAIVPVHVFGNACDVEAINAIAQKHCLKVIYDASHAFGVTYKGESLLKHGDAATLSFHATKLFHTGEGGAIVFKHKKDLERAKKMINFGITGPETIEELGVNAKMSELQAAMGLSVLEEISEAIKGRRRVWKSYEEKIPENIKSQKRNVHSSNNYSYFPILTDAVKAIRILGDLKENNFLARRYFYPSLDLGGPFFCPSSRKVSSSIVCLPFYHDLSSESVEKICKLLKEGS
ncbi:DegT/DnrJ/EryC1/StrS family aminotransferase [Chromohalobacter israelensis]|uniref:DegT/DnrJ/EryC1/StrS family aminotransferase n=1 Tax=Chromohalobacter israelensis TaxID=141390 RepID=UPI000D718263|nr:DegT/DnrJ/EryC1/StrS family aminotransferase [Chromohalobacter salexigens]PWW36483.1 dTDP-4-amino-4,6-dideoxygalactose transaminase [Chromohalobacter salexigens]